MAGSLLREALVRLEKDREFPGWVVLHTHDEIGAECPEEDREGTERALRDQMQHVPTWAKGLPLVAETSQNWYYTKTIG